MSPPRNPPFLNTSQLFIGLVRLGCLLLLQEVGDTLALEELQIGQVALQVEFHCGQTDRGEMGPVKTCLGAFVGKAVYNVIKCPRTSMSNKQYCI